MATVQSPSVALSASSSKLALGVVAVLAVYFAYDQVLRYFVWTEDSYGYYWQFRGPLLLHIVGGVTALLAGVFQLWSGLNRKSMGVHPISGRVYVVGIVLGSVGAIALSFMSAAYGVAWGVALFTLAIAWLATTGTAVYCIRRRNVVAHRQWMIRSYIVTFAFVTFRIVMDHVPYESLWGISRPEMANSSIWLVWVVPLIAYEIYLQIQRT